MGDLSALMEIAKEELQNEDGMEEISSRMMSGKFTLNDMYHQMLAINKMGPLQKVMSLIPGMSKMEDKINYEETQARLLKYRYIMDSMTMEEKDDPSVIKSSGSEDRQGLRHIDTGCEGASEAVQPEQEDREDLHGEP